MLPLQLLTDFVTGQLGGSTEQANAAAISRLVIAGNLIGPTTVSKAADASYAKHIEAETVASIRELDEVRSHTRLILRVQYRRRARLLV